MSNKSLIVGILVTAVSVAVWVAATVYLHNSYKTGEVVVRGPWMEVRREVKVDREGKIREVGFLESSQGKKLVVLTLLCVLADSLAFVGYIKTTGKRTSLVRRALQLLSEDGKIDSPRLAAEVAIPVGEVREELYRAQRKGRIPSQAEILR